MYDTEKEYLVDEMLDSYSCECKAVELQQENDMLADENKKMAEYLLYLNDCNKLDLKRDGFGWLIV